MPDTATLQARLAEAEEALHRLAIGEKEVQAGYNGKSVTFNQSSMQRLRAYIAELKRQLGQSGRPGPIGVVQR